MRRMIIGAAALMLVLSACEIRAEIDVNDDGSGTFGFVFAMEPMFFGALPGGADPLAETKSELRADGLPWRIEDYQSEGLRGFRATLPFQSVEHLLRMMAEQSEASGSGPFDVGDGFVLEKAADGGWTFQATGSSPGADLGFGGGNPFESPSFGGDFGGEGDLGFTPEMPELPAGADGLLRFEVQVSLPGDAASHNADEVRQRGGKSTFIWRMGLTDEGPTDVRAATTPAAGGFPMLPAAGIVLVVLGGIVVALRKRGPVSSGAPPVVLEGFTPANGNGNGRAAPSDGQPDQEPAPVAGPPRAAGAVEQPSLLDDLGQD